MNRMVEIKYYFFSTSLVDIFIKLLSRMVIKSLNKTSCCRTIEEKKPMNHYPKFKKWCELHIKK